MPKTVTVALRKESVDRNCPTCQWRRSVKLSLSARRAWIEIMIQYAYRLSLASLSARRAWIEIIMLIKTVTGCVVALRKESVDRNVRYLCWE